MGGVPRDAYWSWGLYDSLIVVFPGLDLVVTRAGSSWQRKGWGGHYDVLVPFLEPIASAVEARFGEEVEVELVFDPPWDASRLSDVARLELGMM